MEYDCPHNPGGVVCHNMVRCVGCGWEPNEKQRRKQTIDAGKMHKNMCGISRLRIKKKRQEVPG